MPTPLYDALKEYAQKNPARFHMPGHKGKPLPVPELAGLDIQVEYDGQGVQRMRLNGEDVSEAIRVHEVSQRASQVAALPEVRAFLLDFQRRQALERGLAQLPEHYRSVLVLRELSGLSYQEIGDVLKLDLGTVRSRLARARGELRKILRKDGNFFDSGASNPVNKKGGAP